MRCRLCNEPLNLLRRLAKQKFCCAAHRRQCAQREQRLALDRLMAPTAPRPPEPSMCGFQAPPQWIRALAPRPGETRPLRVRAVLWDELLLPDFAPTELPLATDDALHTQEVCPAA